jgi:hypothetical protein
MRGLLELFALTGQMTGKTTSLTSSQTSESNSSLAYSPPFYPSPWMTGKGDWAEAYETARNFVSQLTLLEKVNLTTGRSTFKHSYLNPPYYHTLDYLGGGILD